MTWEPSVQSAWCVGCTVLLLFRVHPKSQVYWHHPGSFGVQNFRLCPDLQTRICLFTSSSGDLVGAEVWKYLYCSWISSLYLYYLSDSLEGESEESYYLHLSGLPLDVTHRASQPGVLERALGHLVVFQM